MNNIRDWCISRQIWWGHKIPIEGTKDVLDTWFSSALWPFATLGWPKETEDLKYFYPTAILSTARDINMLWVVRMIFSGLEFMKEKPFSDIYVHPTIFNIEGKRMSKSLGTGVDPLELIDKYGTDAVRFGLTYINTGTQDIKFDENAILAGKKFANKIWNISRFVLQQIGNSKFEALNPKQIPNPKSQTDKIILIKLNQIIQSTDENLDNFHFGQAAHELYDFIWHDLADVYIENSKSQILNPKLKENTNEILLYVLIDTLKLLHPLMPFITEEIWQNLYVNKLVAEKILITAVWPTTIS
jgi:valyl-tRNA synthetase